MDTNISIPNMLDTTLKCQIKYTLAKMDSMYEQYKDSF